MKIRPATVDDATGMAAVQNEIFSAGLRKAPTDITAVLEHYLQHADRIECSVAEDDDGRILGFQSLRYARTDNPYGVAEGWGIIGTHVSPQAARRGVGSALFAATRRAAEAGMARAAPMGATAATADLPRAARSLSPRRPAAAI